MKSILLIIFLGVIPLLYGQSCKEYFADGEKFTYMDGGKKYGIVTIKRDLFIEKYSDSEVIITSKIKWVSDCSYNMTIVKTKGPTAFKVGMTMTIEILSIKKNKAFYRIKGLNDGKKKFYIKVD